MLCIYISNFTTYINFGEISLTILTKKHKQNKHIKCYKLINHKGIYVTKMPQLKNQSK